MGSLEKPLIREQKWRGQKAGDDTLFGIANDLGEEVDEQLKHNCIASTSSSTTAAASRVS
jgi:hypothetical protein